VSVVLEKEMSESRGENFKRLPREYGCEIIFEKSNIDQAKDPSLPNDAYLIWYNVDGETYMDVTRTKKRVDLFDLYYDRYGPGSVQKIDFGYGRTNPKLWGYKPPEDQKKKRR